MSSPNDVIHDQNKTIRMRDYKMEGIAEVEMPPHSKRPRLDFVEPGLDSSRFHDKTTSRADKGINADAGFQTCSNGIADFDPSKNGVMKTNMADAVSAGDLDLNSARNDVTDDSEDGKQSTEMADPGNDSDSDISNISGGSEMAWRPMAGPMAWVQEQMMAGKDPRVILRRIIPDPDIIPDHLEDFILWKIVASIVSEPPRRKKLKHINTVDDVVTLLKTSKKIMVLTGAGVSVSCGIPDFRSRNGIYARLAVDFPDLPDPQAMFDISYFRHDPRPFFKFAKEIYPGQFEPSRCHKFISLLDRKGKLLRNYTQNIDTLEQVAGIKNVIQCHGSFATATCMTCRYKVDAEAVRNDIFDQVIPHCPRCSPSSTEAVMKPDIVFFGESLPEEFHTQMAADKDVCDLLIVVGSSLKVRPVALIPNSIPAEIPQVLINREPLRHLNFDVELLGDCDVILGELCHRLGGEWSDLFTDYTRLEEVTKGELSTPTVSDSDNGKVSLASSSDPSQQASSTSVQSCSTTETNSALNNAEISCISEIKSEGDVAPYDTKALCSSDAKAKDNVSTIPCQSGASNLPDSNGGSHASAVHTKGDNSPKSSQSRGQDHDNENCTSEHGESGVSAATLRDWWQSRHSSISSRLLSNQYLYVPPHRYVFNGAEVYSDSESEDGQYDDADEESSLSSFGAADNEPNKSVCETADDKGKMDKSRHIESCSDVPHGESIKNGAAVNEPLSGLAAGHGVAAHINGHTPDFNDKEKVVSRDAATHGGTLLGEGGTSPVVHDITDKNGATHSNVTMTQSNSSPS